MRRWAFGGGVLVLTLLVNAMPAIPQDDCPTGRPVERLVRGVTPAFGKSPLWVTTGRGPVPWEGPNNPVTLLWIRESSVRGMATVSGTHRKTGAKLAFTKFGERLATRQPRYQLNPLGYKPKNATPEELQRYEFDYSYGWFPEAGCYEMNGRVGREQVAFYLQVGK